MFIDCTSLTSAPALPATTLAKDCYANMFYECAELNKVEVSFTDWGEGNTSNWLNGVASTGDFICPDGLIKKSGADYIPERWSINGHLPLYLNFKANAPSSRVQLNMVGGESTGLTLEYSTDECQTWAPYTITYDADTNGSIGLPITLANVGDKVYFRKSGNGEVTAFSASDNSYYRFSVYGSVAADGNIMSLIDRYAETTTIPGAYCFAHLFESCTGLTTAPQLPATTLKPYCYASMFSGCTGLTSAPALPATTLEKDCYNRMFYYCTKLNEIKVGFTDWTVTVNEIEYTPTKDWMYNVSSDGVFFCHAGLDRTQRDASHIPAGWMAMNYRYVVTANSADESKGTVSGGGTYEEGTEVTLTATPAEGCIFKQWSDGTTANPYVFTATKDVTLTAQFTKSYTVQVSSADESKGTVSGGGTYEEGTEVTLTATPAKNYEFEKWSDGTTANPYVFSATRNVTLTAFFKKISRNITDGTEYTATESKFLPEVIYTRTFDNTNWQALYVPFSMNYEEWCEKFDIADIHNFIEYDDDNNGTVDRTYLVAIKMASGSTEPNYPYLIRAKETGTYSLVLQNKTLEAAEITTIDCRSVKTEYTFTGTYTGVTDMYDKGYYALAGGVLSKAESADVTLNPQRWYMEVTSRRGGSATKAQSIQILVDGEEGIESLTPDPSPRGRGGESAFDLMGRSVSGAVKGISIVNGKKIIK